jgi:hypothetical protein
VLGHASAVMTLDRYADLFDDDLDAVADRLDSIRESLTLNSFHSSPVIELAGRQRSLGSRALASHRASATDVRSSSAATAGSRDSRVAISRDDFRSESFVTITRRPAGWPSSKLRSPDRPWRL